MNVFKQLTGYLEKIDMEQTIMSRISRLVLCLGIVLPMTIVVKAQERTTAPKQDTSEQEATEKAALPRLDAQSPKSVFIVICDVDPTKMIVLDDNGRWISNIKSASIQLVADQPTTVTCTMYDGIFRPTKPDMRVWQLSQIKSVSVTQFQNFIDSLQNDHEAVKKSLSRE